MASKGCLRVVRLELLNEMYWSEDLDRFLARLGRLTCSDAAHIHAVCYLKRLKRPFSTELHATVLFLAQKYCDDIFYGARDFCRAVGVDPRRVLAAEAGVLKALGYRLYVGREERRDLELACSKLVKTQKRERKKKRMQAHNNNNKLAVMRRPGKPMDGLRLERPGFAKGAAERLLSLVSPSSVCLEVGTGGSTLFYARRAGRVVAVGLSARWTNLVYRHLYGHGLEQFARLHPCDGPEAATQAVRRLPKSHFDVLSLRVPPLWVDAFLHVALPRMKPGALLVLAGEHHQQRQPPPGDVEDFTRGDGLPVRIVRMESKKKKTKEKKIKLKKKIWTGAQALPAAVSRPRNPQLSTGPRSPTPSRGPTGASRDCAAGRSSTG